MHRSFATLRKIKGVDISGVKLPTLFREIGAKVGHPSAFDVRRYFRIRRGFFAAIRRGCDLDWGEKSLPL